MPDYTPILRARVPLDTEASVTPADLMRLGSDLEAKGAIPTVATTAERDADYGGLAAGKLVTTSAPPAVWMKTGPAAGAWSQVWGDTGWIQITNFLNGWQPVLPVAYRVISGIVYWRGQFQPPAGYLPGTWIPILDVPNIARAPGGRHFAVSNANIALVSAGLRYVVDNARFEGFYGAAGGYAIPAPHPYPNS